MKYTHILFDVDNTLFDFDETERLAMRELFAEIGLEDSEANRALYHRINQSWWKRFEEGGITPAQVARGRISDTLAAAGLDYDADVASESMIRYLGSHSIMYDGALELAERLAPHCRMYFATNGLSRVQHARVDGSPIRKYIQTSFISEEIGFTKPSAEYFDYVLNAMGNVPRKQVLMVGDSLRTDILGGMNAGLDTCWYNPGEKPSGDIRPTYIAKTFEEIAEIILDGKTA